MATKIVDVHGKKIDKQIMLAPEQCRAARGWLDWSQDELAKRANVSLSTVRDFEKGRRSPVRNNLLAIRHALEQSGISVLFDDVGTPVGIGWRERKAAG